MRMQFTPHPDPHPSEGEREKRSLPGIWPKRWTRSSVAQACSLLYRRFSTCRRMQISGWHKVPNSADRKSAVQQSLTLCYGGWVFSSVFVLMASLINVARADALSEPNSKIKVPPIVPFALHAFPLTDVRLLDGPFKHAMELDEKYLLSLDVDRLLHNFRVNAGLPSTAEPLGGWEDPKCELRGHFVGHYLSACALMYTSTADPRF